jgi:hypothetical protein
MATALRIRTPIVNDLEASFSEKEAPGTTSKKAAAAAIMIILLVPGGSCFAVGLYWNAPGPSNIGLLLLLMGCFGVMELRQRS